MTSSGGDGGERLAPITYLPGADRPAVSNEAAYPSDEPVRWAVPLESSAAPFARDTGTGAPEPLRLSGGSEVESGESATVEAEDALTKRLRRSALSEREARAFLAQRDVDTSIIEATIERFVGRGWIDDAVLAEQLLHAGTTRKGQGRRAIAQALAARGIPRDIADAALADLPDDDAERALEYARSKAHGLRSYDMDTALRRLIGQLSRRGYGGSVASIAARTALTESRGGTGGVRFR